VATRNKTARTASRSPKAGRPPKPTAPAARVKRRQKRATAAVKKDTMVMQTTKDPRAGWSGSRASRQMR
jgi:hypothetical protein